MDEIQSTKQLVKSALDSHRREGWQHYLVGAKLKAILRELERCERKTRVRGLHEEVLALLAEEEE